MDAGWAASAPRYPAAKTLVASLPAVEIGSVIEYEYERHKRDRPFFAATHVFRGSNPINRETMKLTAPASVSLQVLKDDNGVAVPDESLPAEKPAIVETQERQGEKVSWQWQVRDQAAIQAGGHSAAVHDVQSRPADHGGELGRIRPAGARGPAEGGRRTDGRAGASRSDRSERQRAPRSGSRPSGISSSRTFAGPGRDATICRCRRSRRPIGRCPTDTATRRIARFCCTPCSKKPA